MNRYLRLPKRQPEYRQDRPHETFATNLHADPRELKRLIMSEFAVDGTVESLPHELLSKLLEEKYEQPDWVNRR